MIRREQHEVDLSVVGLRDELLDHAGQRHDLGLVVHRERMVCQDGDLQHDRQYGQRRRDRHGSVCPHTYFSSAILMIASVI